MLQHPRPQTPETKKLISLCKYPVHASARQAPKEELQGRPPYGLRPRHAARETGRSHIFSCVSHTHIHEPAGFFKKAERLKLPSFPELNHKQMVSRLRPTGFTVSNLRPVLKNKSGSLHVRHATDVRINQADLSTTSGAAPNTRSTF